MPRPRKYENSVNSYQLSAMPAYQREEWANKLIDYMITFPGKLFKAEEAIGLAMSAINQIRNANGLGRTSIMRSNTGKLLSLPARVRLAKQKGMIDHKTGMSFKQLKEAGLFSDSEPPVKIAAPPKDEVHPLRRICNAFTNEVMEGVEEASIIEPPVQTQKSAPSSKETRMSFKQSMLSLQDFADHVRILNQIGQAITESGGIVEWAVDDESGKLDPKISGLSNILR